MTTVKQKNVPALRFPGFTDAWEQRELGETLRDLKSGLSRMLSNDDIGLPVVRANNINDGQFDMMNDIKYWYENDPQGAKTENYLVHKNDILINFINSEAKMGTATIVQEEPNRSTIYTTNILKAQVADNFDANFWFTLTQTYQYKFDIKAITKPAVNQASFTTVDFKKLGYQFPVYDEQLKIGNFFNQLDTLITLHQRKLDLLKEQKKGFLQKMFPKNGEKVPELRFKGFTDDWEQRKFLDVVNRLNKTSNSSELPKLEFEDVIAGQGQLNKDISEKLDNRKGILFRPENILYGKLRPYLKNWFFPGFPGIALGDFWVFEARNSIPAFVYYLIQSSNYQKVANDTSGTKMPRSDWKKVSTTLFAIPNLEEQQKIGSLFKKLDDTIALHQRKIDLLKEQKKSFLQKMFV